MPRSTQTKPRKSPRLVTDEERARVAELHAAGLSRNAIAAELGRPWSTVTKIARQLGLSFDRSQTRAAVEARKVDLAAMRADLAHLALVKAKGFLDALDQPFLAFNFGGKDNTYEEHLLDRPPTGDIRNLMTAFGIATQRSLELTKFDVDPNEGASAVDAWLDHMAGQGSS